MNKMFGRLVLSKVVSTNPPVRLKNSRRLISPHSSPSELINAYTILQPGDAGRKLEAVHRQRPLQPTQTFA